MRLLLPFYHFGNILEMVQEGSTSQLPLKEDEYGSGEIVALTRTPILTRALFNERWLNISEETQEYWLSVIRSGSLRFVGTILSETRQQVELTLIYPESSPQAETYIHFCVSLPDFRRFLADPR